MKSVYLIACLLFPAAYLMPSAAWAAEEAVLTYTITNQGQPMPKAWFAVYRPGKRESYIRYEYSGKPLKVEAGTYDVGVHFEKDAVKLVKWIENKSVSGQVQETFDLGVGLTELCYTITNGGTSLGNKGWYAIHAAKDENYLHYAYSGKCFLAPSATYQVALHHDEDVVKTIKWLDDEKIEGPKIEKTVELNQPVAQAKYTITNNGQPVGRKAWWGVYRLGEHDRYIAYKYSGDAMTLAAGTYDIGIEYTDGDLRTEKWLENEKLEGVLSKSVELAEAVTQAKVTITNGGADVGRKAWWGVYKPGDRSRYLAYKYSGEPMTVSAGTYDVGISFTDGDAREERWLENQVFGAEYTNTVELGLPLAEVKINIVNNGADVGPKAWWGLYEKGERGDYLAYKYNGKPMTIAEGAYDLGVHFQDGAVRLIRWVPDFEAKGKVEKTIDLSAGLADLTVRVVRKGQPLEKAWCGAYKTKKSSAYEAYAYSEKPMRVLHGTYDIGCFYAEAGVSAEKWLEGQEIKADTRLEVELDLQPATITIRSTGAAAGAAREAFAGAAGAGAGGVNISLILDSSGSMAAKVEEKKNRLDVAKEVLSEVIDGLPKDVRVELQVYGTAPKAKVDCRDTKTLAPLGPVDASALKAAVNGLTPSGYTPIAYSLERAAANLPKGRSNSLILVTDGIESCNGDPCGVASRLSAEGLVTRSFVVGFGLDLDKGKFLSCIGKYYPASDRKGLQSALKEAVSESLKPATGHVMVYRAGERKEIVVQGALDEPLTLPSGIYDVVIQIQDKSYTWANAKIAGKMEQSLAAIPGVK